MKREEYTTIKIFATLLVVLGHVTKFYYPGGGVFPVEYNAIIGGFSKILYAFHMPLFVFISGAVYSYNVNQLGKYRDIKRFLFGKFRRLMVPYFFWGIGYVAPVMQILDITDYSAGYYITRCILMGGDSRHLWYLWTLFLIFIICGIIRLVTNNTYKYISFAAIVIILVIAYMGTGLAPIWNVLYYGFYFLLGYFFDLYKIKIDKLFVRIGWFFIIMIFGMVCIPFIQRNLFFDVMFAFVGIIVTYYFASMYSYRIKKWKVYRMLAKDSFGIYLIHPMLIYIMFYYGKNYELNPYIFCLFSVVLALTVSYFFTELVRKVHCQILLGE